MDRLTIEKCEELLIKNADGEYRSLCFGCESINKCNPEKMTCGFYKALEKLKEYEDLDEQGKLLKLPCAVGDSLYIPYSRQQYAKEVKVQSFMYDGHDFFINTDFVTLSIRDIRVDAFLTQEEAEEALKRTEDRNE